MRELKARRKPILQERELAKKAGDIETVEACNVELRRLNRAIWEGQPYEEATKPAKSSKTMYKGGKTMYKGGKKTSTDILV
jgi:hypothetical protein